MIKLVQSFQFFKKDKFFDAVFFVIILVFFIRASFYYYQIIIFPFQLELREGMALLITNAFLNGNNPYAEINQPLLHNQYGFLYSMVLLPFSQYFGPTLFIHRLINFIFILISCIIVFDICYEKGKSFLYSSCALVILYQTFLEQSECLAFPNSMGVCLMLLSIYVPWKTNFTTKSLMFCIIVGILAFFTKIYFIIGSICVAVYLIIFRSRREAIIFSLSLSLITIFAIITVVKFFDFYFEDTILVSYLGGKTSASWRHLVMQVLYFIKLYSGLFIVMTLIIIKKFQLLNNDIPSLIRGFCSNFKKTRELITNNLRRDYFFRVCFVISCTLMIFLGRNSWAFFSYFAQLILPFMLIVFIDQFSKNFISKKIAGLFLIATLIMIACVYPNNTDFYKSYNKQNFLSLNEIVQTHNTMYNSPSLVSLFLEHKKDITDSGQLEYFKLAKTERAKKIYNDYLNDISYKINTNYYDVIFEYSHLLLEINTLENQLFFKKYKLFKTIPIKELQLEHARDIKIWLRRDFF